MNSQLIKQEIENILSTVKQPTRKQYPVAKHQLKALEALGILDLMPRQYGEIGHTNAAVVIAEASRSASTVMNKYGEGEATGSSKLYQLLHTVETTERQTWLQIAFAKMKAS